MKLGTKVALKENHPKLDHRCKGFVVGEMDLNMVWLWCLKCEGTKAVFKHDLRRVVPKPIGWVNFYADNGRVQVIPSRKTLAAEYAKEKDEDYTNEIAPVYLGRKRRVR